MGMIYSVNFHNMYHVIPMVMKVESLKGFFIQNLPLPPNTTCLDGNALK